MADSGSLFSLVTAGYEASPGEAERRYGIMGNWSKFSLDAVDWMLKDPQVALGAALRRAPLLCPLWTLEGDAVVKKWLEAQLKAFWTLAMPSLVDAMFHTAAAVECVYKRSPEGYLCFKSFADFNPRDIKIITAGNEYRGMKIRDQTLRGIKGFAYLHNRRYRQWFGNSELEAAFDPWLEKWDYKGAKHSRRLWFYKSAWTGGILIHPKGSMKVNGQDLPYAIVARQVLEYMAAGATLTFEAAGDSTAGDWDYKPPVINGDGSALIEYVDVLDRDIQKGMGIPQDILSQESDGGSFAGRTIPLQSFFIGQQIILQRIMSEVWERLLYPMMVANFGQTTADSTACTEIEVDTEKLLPTAPPTEDGGTVPGGAGINKKKAAAKKKPKPQAA
jgi:hypothetical protein